MRRPSLLTLPVLLLVLASSACGDDGGSGDEAPAVTAEDLDGRTFESTSVTGHDLVADTVVTLDFADGQLGFSAGCNSMSAGYDVAAGRLELSSEVASTMMACPDDLQAQDTWLSGFLADGAAATLVGDQLTLTEGDVVMELAG